MIHKSKCKKYEITTIRISSDSHHHLNDHIDKNSLNFRIIADFDFDNEIDKANIGK